MMEKKIAEIKREFEKADNAGLENLFTTYGDDNRAGVCGLIEKYKKRLLAEAKEETRLENMLTYERRYGDLGAVCGIDEAGRGPLAGPVVAGAVILPEGLKIPYLNDSKKLSPARREQLFDVIMEKALAVGVGMASPARIDEINILQATYEAMRQAIGKLKIQPDVLLNDAVRIPGIDIPQVPIVKGDGKSLSIAAASVIAKVTRDRIMEEYHKLMPEYSFAGHKGYGSAAHISAIREFGPSPIHRKTFIKNFL